MYGQIQNWKKYGVRPYLSQSTVYGTVRPYLKKPSTVHLGSQYSGIYRFGQGKGRLEEQTSRQTVVRVTKPRDESTGDEPSCEDKNKGVEFSKRHHAVQLIHPNGDNVSYTGVAISTEIRPILYQKSGLRS